MESNFQQHKRFVKIFSDKFYVVDWSKHGPTSPTETLLTFKISGSQKTVYTITASNTGRFSCDCLDMLTHCKKNNCVCKHICFVVIKVMRDHDLGFFQKNNFQLNIRVINEFLSKKDAISLKHQNNDLTQQYLQNVDVKKMFNVDTSDHHETTHDDCCICYEDIQMTNNHTCLRKCPRCRNILHKVCIEKWLLSSQSCPLCRSSWQEYNKTKSSYIQLQ